MRHFMTAFCNVKSNGLVASHRLALGRVSCLLAVASVMTLAPAIAKDPAPAEIKAANKGPSIHAKVQSEVAIPECLEKLKLSSQQQDQIKGIIQTYDGSLGVVWKQFSDRYMQTIAVESSLLAAIEDNLTEVQRKQVHEQRRRTAQHEKAIAGTNDKDNQAQAKPGTEKIEDLATTGVSLTQEQESAADKVQEKYHSQLRSMNRDIQGLHTRLVSLEADKLVEIEKVLTKEQLSQLRMHRQNAPTAQKLAISRVEQTKTE